VGNEQGAEGGGARAGHRHAGKVYRDGTHCMLVGSRAWVCVQYCFRPRLVAAANAPVPMWVASVKKKHGDDALRSTPSATRSARLTPFVISYRYLNIYNPTTHLIYVCIVYSLIKV